MGASKDKTYCRTLRRVITAIHSEESVRGKLGFVVRGVARSMDASASVLLLDSDRKKLIHNISWGLPQYYINKGVLDAEKSLGETLSAEAVVIEDASKDSRIQYPEMIKKVGICSILGMPIKIDGVVIGSLRVYQKTDCGFTNHDISFINAVANLASIIFSEDMLKQASEIDALENNGAITKKTALQQSREIKFVNASEEQFARILDFYDIEWVYEPRSFPLKWSDGHVSEMFTPDFYLPQLESYIELTTLKQSLVTDKNRKLRRLKELYPEIKIILLYKKDYERLLAKYGVGPLAQARCHDVTRVLYSAAEIGERVCEIAKKISKDYKGKRPILIGAQRGFICFMADLIRQISVPLDIDFMGISYYGEAKGPGVKITKDVDLSIRDRHVIMVEDIVDTGITLNYILKHLKTQNPASLAVCTLLDRRARRLVETPIEYTGFEVPDEFVVGYGLDYMEEYRNLPFIGIADVRKPSKNK